MQEPHVRHGKVLELVDSAAYADDIFQQVHFRLCRLGYKVDFLFCVSLAFEEALANAVQHGSRHDLSKKLRVRLTAVQSGVEVEIEDEGDGFNPDEVPDPLSEDNLVRPPGRGLLLMRSLMDRVVFNDRGNRVTMFKAYPHREAEQRGGMKFKGRLLPDRLTRLSTSTMSILSEFG